MTSPRSMCPACSSRRVEAFMNYGGNRVDYYHCLDCHHVWNIPKGEQGPVNHVTPLPGPKPITMGAVADDLFARADRAMNARRSLCLEALRLRGQSIELALQSSEIVAVYQEIFGSAGRIQAEVAQTPSAA